MSVHLDVCPKHAGRTLPEVSHGSACDRLLSSSSNLFGLAALEFKALQHQSSNHFWTTRRARQSELGTGTAVISAGIMGENADSTGCFGLIRGRKGESVLHAQQLENISD